MQEVKRYVVWWDVALFSKLMFLRDSASGAGRAHDVLKGPCGWVYVHVSPFHIFSNQHSPIRATALPTPCHRLQDAGVDKLSNLLPLHQPQEISVICLTKMLSCLWECSDRERVHAGHMQARSLASQCRTPGHPYPGPQQPHTKQSLDIAVSQAALCRVLAAKVSMVVR